jgi:two-component system sensor histidine kinase/response regulator
MSNPEIEKKGDILIVDDVAENLELLFNMLTRNNYEVRRVLSGKIAIKIAEIEPPDLILLDIRMPEIDGYEVCRRLKKSEITKNIPVIFLSALNDIFDKVRAFQVGGVDYINKPFHLEEVLARVENQLKLVRMQKQLQQQNLVLLKTNKDLHQRTNELEILNKELAIFNSRVSHDIKNHLQVINGLSAILWETYKQEKNLDRDYADFLKQINDAGNEINQIIEDLKRLSLVNNTHLEISDVNLSEMVEGILLNLKKQQFWRKIDFKIRENVIVKGDKNLLKIALENLLNNAWKYTSKKDHSFIEFGCLSPPHPNHEAISNNLNLATEPVYFIKDNGAGFEMEQAAEIFAPFKRLHSSEDFEGTGIGLATVYKIINLHNGKIWCEAQVNQGATFFFTLMVD